jgi:hypothetical protein
MGFDMLVQTKYWRSRSLPWDFASLQCRLLSGRALYLRRLRINTLGDLPFPSKAHDVRNRPYLRAIHIRGLS